MRVARWAVVAALGAEFEDHLGTTQIKACIKRVETAIKAAHPSVQVLFVKPQTQATREQRIAGLWDAYILRRPTNSA